MSIGEIRNLDNQELRSFGLITGTIVTVLFGLLLPWIFKLDFPRWPWVVTLVLSAWALLIPQTLNSLYRGWMKVGFVLGWVNTRIILTMLFYTIFLPIGLILKITGKDPMTRSLRKEGSDYRVTCIPMGKEHFERPY
jgi:hypothetical protein